MEITFLGTGTSHGVPQIDCMLNDYKKCPHSYCSDTGPDPKHVRTRSSIFVEVDGQGLLIDTSMDFRYQAMRARLKRIDAILITHGHADHIYGLPDVRSYCFHQKACIPIYGSNETISTLQQTFKFIFQPPELKGGGIAEVNPHSVTGSFQIGDVDVVPIPVLHAQLTGCVGYRIGKMAYIPDVKEIPESSFGLLEGLDLLIIDSLRRTPHSTHVSLSESIRIVEQVKPKQSLFTHVCHDIDYGEEEKLFPENMKFAYDTLRIKI